MAALSVTALRDLEDAQRTFERVRKEIEAVPPSAFATLNVDLVSATSLVLGVCDAILEYRDQMAKLSEFDVRNIDQLADYAKATWYLHITNLPEPEPKDADAIIEETMQLRRKLLLWLAPLVESGYFERSAYDAITAGPGRGKDGASDVVAAVGLFRSRWGKIQSMCGITEEDLVRGAEIGPAAFSILSRREHREASPSEASQSVRAAFTLLDTAYDQCRRALQYLRWSEGDANEIAPNLRSHRATRRAATAPTAAPAEADGACPLVESDSGE